MLVDTSDVQTLPLVKLEGYRVKIAFRVIRRA